MSQTSITSGGSGASTPRTAEDGPVVLRMAVTQEDRDRIYRFRYEIYVEEMRRVQKHADHERRMIREPFDSGGHLMIAERCGRMVGTLRTNFARETDLGYYRGLFRMDGVGDAYPARVSLTTKLMVGPEYRSGTLAVRMACALYRFGLENGIAHDFIDCNPHLERFFQRLGFRPYMERVVHPEYGLVLPLRLDLTDLAHLRRTGSPFARIPG